MVKGLTREQVASDTIAWIGLKCISEANFLVMIDRIADWKVAETTVVFVTDCKGAFAHMFNKQCFRR